MDSNNWRPPQMEGGMDTSGWRNDLSSESRQKIVNKIMDTLQRHMPPTGPDGMSELKKIAVRFEEKIFSAAANQQDYLRKISLKMLSLETKAHASAPTSLVPTSAGGNQKSLDPATLMIQSQIRNSAQGLTNGLQLPGQAQPRQQLLTPNLQNSIVPGGMQSSAGLPSALNSISALSQTPMSAGGQGSGLPNMSGISQSSINNPTGQGLSQNVLFTQRQLQSRQQQHQQQVAQQQHQQQSQLLYQQQLQQQQQQHAFIKQKLHQQSQFQQQQAHLQQQQSVLQQNQLQPSQQTILQSAQQPALQSTQQTILQQAQPSVLQPAQQSVLQQTQQSTVQQTSQSVLQQHQQGGLRQQQSQQSVMQQQPSILQQQQATVVQQSLLQPQQQQSPLLGQQNNVNMQQQQHPLQQLLQSKSGQHQQTQQPSSSLLQPQSQQLQQPSQQQQLLSQLQSQPHQLQQQQSLLQPPNSMQQELQQRLQPSGGLLQQQQQSSIEQQKQLYQAQQRGLSEASSTSVDSSGQTGQSSVADWQEKVYQRLQGLKDKYSQEINELYRKLVYKCQQPMAHDQLEKLKHYKNTLQRMMSYFQVQKSRIPPGFMEDKVDAFEKQILTILNSFKQRKSAPQQQQGQQQLQPQPGSQVQSMQQQPQPQVSQMQQQEKHANQLQQMNIQASVTSMQPNGVTSMQHGSMPLLQQTGIQTTQQNIRSAMQPGANLSSTQGTGVGALQQNSVNALQQNNINPLQQNNVTLQQNNINSLQQSGINPLQQNNINPVQPNNSTVQHHHQQALKQQQELMQAQQLKQMQQRQIHHHLLQQQQQQQQQLQHQIQQQQQQLHQQQKQQQTAQLQAQQMPQLQQMNDLNSESKSKQVAAAKQAYMQQHHQLSQRTIYQQQLKPGSSLSVSSPQLLQATSPQVSQQSSPQVDQQSLVTSSLQLPKVGTPMQPVNSPFTVPSPSILPAHSPLVEDTEKQSSAISSISNAGSGQGLPQTATALSHAQSLAIATPGISASPLLADFSPGPAQNIVNLDGQQTVSPGLHMGDKSNTTEPPLERLIKVINLMSSKALTSAVSDISSVVSLIDRMAGSAPGNGSRAAVGEDLVAMTKCRLQARNLMSQDGSAATKKMRRRMSSMPLSTASSGGSVTNSLQQHNNLESPEMESTATSKIKRPRLEINHALRNEIREINQQLIDTVVDVSEDDNDAAAAAAKGRDGIVVKCSYNAIALSPSMKSRYKLTEMSPISPLRLLIPANYPNCSPVLLDKVPVEPFKEYEDLSSKAKAEFNVSVRSLSQPMSLKAMARTWDISARNAVTEYAHQSGGGSFSSRFGTWENCASA
eukprot:Gb_25435 [translate_table: standard]